MDPDGFVFNFTLIGYERGSKHDLGDWQVSLERTEAVVLRGVDFSQTSRIVTFLCPERGRLSCMAKGVRRPKSELSGVLDTFSRVEVVYSWKVSRSVQQLVECSLVNGYTALKNNLEKSTYMAFPLELAYKTAHPNEPSENLYDALVAGFEGIESWAGEARDYCSWTVLRLLSAAGFEPAVRACCLCGEAVPAAPGFSFEGGVTCSSCRSDRSLSAEGYRALRESVESALVCPEAKQPEELFDLVAGYASGQLDCSFRSLGVINQIVGRPRAART